MDCFFFIFFLSPVERKFETNPSYSMYMTEYPQSSSQYIWSLWRNQRLKLNVWAQWLIQRVSWRSIVVQHAMSQVAQKVKFQYLLFTNFISFNALCWSFNSGKITKLSQNLQGCLKNHKTKTRLTCHNLNTFFTESKYGYESFKYGKIFKVLTCYLQASSAWRLLTFLWKVCQLFK